MILNVTFSYQALVLGARQRNPRLRRFLDTVPVEVRELDPREAPVALRVHETDERTRELRWDGSNLLAPVEVPKWEVDEGAAPGSRGADWLARAAATGWEACGGPDAFGAGCSGDGDLFPGAPEADPSVARVLAHHHIREDGREEMIQKVRSAAARYVVVDGTVHLPAPEPVYRIGAKGLRDRDEDGRYMSVTDAPGWKEAGSLDFRADERDAMLAAFRVSPGFLDREIEVLVPEAVRAPLPEAALAEAARYAKQDLGSEVLEGDAKLFAAYAALRDALRSFEAGIAAGDAEPPAADLVDALRTGARALRTLGEAVPSRSHSHAIRLADRAIDRIDARAMAQAFSPAA